MVGRECVGVAEQQFSNKTISSYWQKSARTPGRSPRESASGYTYRKDSRRDLSRAHAHQGHSETARRLWAPAGPFISLSTRASASIARNNRIPRTSNPRTRVHMPRATLPLTRTDLATLLLLAHLFYRHLCLASVSLFSACLCARASLHPKPYERETSRAHPVSVSRASAPVASPSTCGVIAE